MKHGGRIPRSVTAICETFKISCLMGKHFTNGCSANHFKGPIIPFGSMIEFHIISGKDLSRLDQFGKKMLPGIFLGYVLYAVKIWKGDFLVADIEELEEMDASEIHAKEVMTPKNGEHFIFPIADGKSKTIWRRSGFENIYLDT